MFWSASQQRREGDHGRLSSITKFHVECESMKNEWTEMNEE